jgi:hypothetical protein
VKNSSWQDLVRSLIYTIPYGISKLDISSLKICGSEQGFGIKNLYSNLNELKTDDLRIEAILQENSTVSQLSLECGMYATLLYRILKHNDFSDTFSLEIQRVLGKEPLFFNDSMSTHAFVLITEKVSTLKYIACPIAKDLLDFQTSGYTIIRHENRPLEYYQTAVLGTSDIFLMIDKNLVWSLFQENSNYPPVLIVGNQDESILEVISVLKPISEKGFSIPTKILQLCDLVRDATLNSKHAQREYLNLHEIHNSQLITF